MSRASLPTVNLLASTLAGLALSAAAAAQASDAGGQGEGGDWDMTTRAGLSLVLSAGEDAGRDLSREPVLGEVSLGADASRLLDNGTKIGARVTLRAQADHPDRPGGVGGFSRTGAPTGAFSGLGTGRVDTGLRGRFEEAFVYVDGGWGEALAGRDRGVAARFHEGPPELFALARVDTALIDPSGLSIVRTRHDLTGPSAKLSYASPRLLGLRAGVSFTPDADEAQGLDRDAGARALGPGGRVEMDGAVEAALNISRVISDDGLRLSAGLGWSQASLNRAPGREGQVETWSFGAHLERGRFQLGAAWLASDNGLTGSGDYEAWSVGGQFPLGEDWTGGLVYGEARDDGAALDGQSWSLGVGRELSDNVAIALGWREDRLARPGSADLGPQGIVMEITLSK